MFLKKFHSIAFKMSIYSLFATGICNMPFKLATPFQGALADIFLRSGSLATEARGMAALVSDFFSSPFPCYNNIAANSK